MFAFWILYDVLKHNKALNRPLIPGWFIITIFFSVIALLMYLIVSRPKNIEKVKNVHRKKDIFQEYVKPQWKKSFGAAIHCVAGDGLGIFTAMVIARILDLPFWQEFWFEYIVGFAFGWFIFQFWSMKEMGHSAGVALWKAGRAEFFSMITVMAGMGIVMGYVTPKVLGFSPDPWTYAFWGFGAFGLFLGFLFTLPMNWWLIQRGYKHGMG